MLRRIQPGALLFFVLGVVLSSIAFGGVVGTRHSFDPFTSLVGINVHKLWRRAPGIMCGVRQREAGVC